jgi:hypothetical protein
MMKLRLLLIAAILLLPAPLIHAETPGTQADLASKNAALKAEVAQLQKEVVDLKAQLAGSQSPRDLYLRMRPLMPPPELQLNLSRNGLPSDAIPRQFNGMTYYLIPVAQP